MRTRLLTALGLGALLLTACSPEPGPVADPTTAGPTTPATSEPTTSEPTADPQAESDAAHAALQAALKAAFDATQAALDERQACPPGDDLTCMIAATSTAADVARTHGPLLEAAAAEGGAPCLQEVARLQVQVLNQYVEQERLFATGTSNETYPLAEIDAANDAVLPIQAQQEAALETC
ncbi:hypothetical protein GCM10028777_05790 [Angustibacter speluncae]